jgi:hypothetical protein
MHADDDLRARFRALRRNDDARAPEFPPVVHLGSSVRAERARHRSNGVWLAAAAALVVGLVATRQFLATNDATAQSITTWQSPTNSLVPASGRAVLSPPPLLSSVLDGATTSALWRKGD